MVPAAEQPKLPLTPVIVRVVDQGNQVVLSLRAKGVPDVNIPIDTQAAFELGEALARTAHFVKFGHDVQSDKSYIAEQVRARTTEHYRNFLVTRVTRMLESLREDKKWTNRKLAEEIVDVVVTKFA